MTLFFPSRTQLTISQKDHRYDAYTELKEGMRVVLQSNLRPQSGLVNGAQGTIIAFEPFNPDRLPRKAKDPDDMEGTLRGPHAGYAQHQIKAFAKDNGHQPWPIVLFDNGLKESIYADCAYSELGNEEVAGENKQQEPDPSLLSRTQIPLIAGYAITVHKSQVRPFLSCPIQFNCVICTDMCLEIGHDT